MSKKAEMKRKLLEQRDQLLAEIEALKNRVKGLEMAISIAGGEDMNVQNTKQSRRSGIKGTILDMLGEVGTTGLNAVSAVEMATRRGLHFDRQSVSSLLSRLKKDNTVIYEGEMYKLPQFASGNPTLKVVS
jgi:hypothetical protein